MSADRFRAEAALAPLKAFQRRTVDYVFDRLYGTNSPVRQFLVADEVGLGKTMVARGVIARAIEHLWDKPGRIDVLYICSNQAIAAQNLNRLNVLGRRELALPTRMTLIPLQLRGEQGLDSNRVNFISLTPGTTFELRSSTGVTQERALLELLLEGLVSAPRGLHNLLQVTAGHEPWDRAVSRMTLEGVDERIIERFRRDVQTDNNLFSELESVCAMFPRRRDSYPREMTKPRNSVIARLRAKLSRACVEALQPDLVIMDEFQRFRDLLHAETEAALLAQELFNYTAEDGSAARTLLLSATPYRMLTLSGDSPEEGDHYQDFLETLKFLYGKERGAQVVEELRKEMRGFRDFLHRMTRDNHASGVETRKSIEAKLRQVIARTERVSTTKQRDSMMREPTIPVTMKPADLIQAAAMSEVARVLDAPEIIEYWKSAPYLLNFMRDYSLKQLLEENTRKPSPALLQAIRNARPAMLDRKAINAYQEIEPANGRMRAVMDDIFTPQLEKHLWIPPSLPYYGAPRSSPPVTKSLIFSSWSMVPDALAALLSYEAERRMGVGEAGRTYFEKHRLRPLQFRKDDGRLGGLRTLLLLYPSPALAEMADPLAVFSEHEVLLSEDAMRQAIAERLLSRLSNPLDSFSQNESTTHAEWAAPATLDNLLGKRASAWLAAEDGMRALATEDAFHEHVDELSKAAKRPLSLPPVDGIDFLVDVALGSPAVCALRALKRIAPELAWDDPTLLGAAAKVAWAFRTLFNQHDAIALVRGGADDFYWRRVLAFCRQNNIQAVLDEYAHYLVDAEGLGAAPPSAKAQGVASAMASALSVRPSQIDVDNPRVWGESLTIGKFQMRGRFAMRLSDYKDEDGAAARLSGVRDAFNSPFRPFVLVTTSIGQEGLDFHPYCYRVYHWNLPSNPVDLEQREGRVHRFKGHAVRLNVAEKQGSALQGRGSTPNDPWTSMFEQARQETTVDSDLIPYWIYEGSVLVERRVPILPFSREVTRLAWLKRSLTVYRLAFGQPRQDDLLDYLQSLSGPGMTPEELADLQIQLQPLKSPAPS